MASTQSIERNPWTSRDPHLVARARDLVPLLGAHAEETERLGHLAAESAAALREAGFFTLNSPSAFGGTAAGPGTMVEAFRELARGCGSSAWVSMLLSVGSYTASLFGEEALADVWAADPRAAVCGGLAPTGTTRRTEKGWAVTGRWQPLSGIHEAHWVLVGVPLTDDTGKTIDQGVALIPVTELAVEKTWHVAGMQGTGSNTVTAREVHVPEHRILSFSRLFTQGERRPVVTYSSFTAVVLLGPVLGMAEAALEKTLELLKEGKSVGASIYRNAIDSPSVQFNVANAASLIDTAKLRTERAVADIEKGIAEGAQLDLPTRARIRMDVGTAVQSARDAVDLLLNINGTGGFSLSSPIQRIWRDLETATRHQLLSPDLGREIYGRAVLGIAEQVAPVI
jgi:3-hydroxy-9,10-secoandrosta-1,3,5(10)-triene-9,17-dione monooxygenase